MKVVIHERLGWSIESILMTMTLSYTLDDVMMMMMMITMTMVPMMRMMMMMMVITIR